MKLDEGQHLRKESRLEKARLEIEEGWQGDQEGELLDSEEVFEELRREIEATSHLARERH